MALSLPPFARTLSYETIALVAAHTHILGHEFELVLEAPEIASCARPGQFLEILPGAGAGAVTSRPFSLYRADPAAGTISILYLARGAFTSDLAERRVGDTVSIVGPLGRPFSWDTLPDTCHILVAGGIGAPPIYYLAREVCRGREESDATGVVVINAARTSDMLVGMVEFGALNITLQAATDDGTVGSRGIATELLEALVEERRESLHRCAIYTCGPAPMLRAVSEIAIAHGLPCQVSVETLMPCGVGACGRCGISVRDAEAPGGVREALACWEGPIFEARDILW